MPVSTEIEEEIVYDDVERRIRGGADERDSSWHPQWTSGSLDGDRSRTWCDPGRTSGAADECLQKTNAAVTMGSSFFEKEIGYGTT